MKFTTKTISVVVSDATRAHQVSIMCSDQTLITKTIKSIVADIGAWQGLNTKRQWPKFEMFKHTPISTLNFEVIETLGVEV